MPQRLLPAHADHEPGAARSDDPDRTARIEIVGRQCQGIQYREALAVIQLAAQGWGALPDRDAAIVGGAPDLNIHGARFRFLP